MPTKQPTRASLRNETEAQAQDSFRSKGGRQRWRATVKREDRQHNDEAESTRANYIMDNFFAAISLFRRRKYDECIEVCNGLLQQNALHQGPWELKMRSMTQRVYIDDIEADDDVAGKFGGLRMGRRRIGGPFIFGNVCAHFVIGMGCRRWRWVDASEGQRKQQELRTLDRNGLVGSCSFLPILCITLAHDRKPRWHFCKSGPKRL